MDYGHLEQTLCADGTHPNTVGQGLITKAFQDFGRGLRLAVASNKFQAGTEKLIGLFFPPETFDVVFGQRPDVPLKPSPAVVEEILARTGTAPERVLYVGDSGVDMETARAAGVRSCGVTWGFRSRENLVNAGADFLADTPAELEKLLMN